MSLISVSRDLRAMLAAIPDNPNHFISPPPRVQDGLTEQAWLKAFDAWAQRNPFLVDSLGNEDLDEVMEAVSHFGVKSALELMTLTLKDSTTDASALETLGLMVMTLQTECKYLHDHVNQYLSMWSTSNPFLINEYALLNWHAKNTSTRESLVAASMTWYDWPVGLNYLLRALAIHTRTIEDLLRYNDLLSIGQIRRSQLFCLSPVRLHETLLPSEYGYERAPTVNGLIDFKPPLGNLNSQSVLQHVRSSVAIRDTRRRTALARLSRGQAGVSDFLTPNYVDCWYHSAKGWLDSVIPGMQSQCALKWAQLSSDLDTYHNRWIQEAEYDGNRILRQPGVIYRLTPDRIVVREACDRMALPHHQKRCIQIHEMGGFFLR